MYSDFSYPQQVSNDQEDQDKSEIAFSNGALFSQSLGNGISADERHFSTSNSSIRRGSTIQEVSKYRTITKAVSTVEHKSTNLARHPEYIDYSQRLKTYARWTRNRPDPVNLCEAGFFFTNQYDLVRCFQCGIGLKDFSEGDEPLLEHVRYSKSCQFLADYLGSERLNNIKTKCQTQQSELSSHGQRHIFVLSDNNETKPEQQTESCQQYRHPEYHTVQARLSSFAGWPRHKIQKPLDLAEAGLYYTGFEDQVRCFVCDGGLRRWDPEDIPWTEHCRWFPDCPFARTKKGDEFIALVQASTEYTGEENESATNEHVSRRQDQTSEDEKLTLKESKVNAVLQEHKDACLEMGFHQTDIIDAVEELLKMGNVKPTIEEILDTIDVCKQRQEREHAVEMKQNETPLEENHRLKSLIICMLCGRNKLNVNALFMPCTHHRLCMDCAEPLAQCPVCNRFIRQKVRTYLA